MHRAAPYSNLNMDQIKQLSQYFAVHLNEELQGFFLEVLEIPQTCL